MGKTYRSQGGSSHRRNAKMATRKVHSSRTEKDFEDVRNFKQVSGKIASEVFDNGKNR